MTNEDREAMNAFVEPYVQRLNPIGEIELQLAQTIAQDNFRLNRLKAVEENMFAYGELGPSATKSIPNTPASTTPSSRPRSLSSTIEPSATSPFTNSASPRNDPQNVASSRKNKALHAKPRNRKKLCSAPKPNH